MSGRHFLNAVSLLLLTLQSAACEPRSADGSTSSEQLAAQTEAKSPDAVDHAPAPGCGADSLAAMCGEEQAACGTAPDPEGSCGCAAGSPAPAAPGATEGELSVGEPFVGRERVSVAQLLSGAAEYQGKWVQVEGDVSAMCHHRRSWFALQDDGDRSGKFVRVLTAPGFLVPQGSVGRRARAEGRVEVIEVPAEAAKHYAKGHQLGDPDAVRGPERRVVIRASGAEFI